MSHRRGSLTLTLALTVVVTAGLAALLWAVTGEARSPEQLGGVGVDWDGHLVRAANLWGWAKGGRDTLLGAFGEPAWWQDPTLGRRYPPLHALTGALALSLGPDLALDLRALSRGCALLLLVGAALAAGRAAAPSVPPSVPPAAAPAAALAGAALPAAVAGLVCLGSPTLKGMAAAWPVDLTAAALLAAALWALGAPLRRLRGGLAAGALVGLLALTKTAALLPLLPLLALGLAQAGAWLPLGTGLLIGLFALLSLQHPLPLGWPAALTLSGALALLVVAPGAPRAAPWGHAGARAAAALALLIALPWHLVHTADLRAHLIGHPVEPLAGGAAEVARWTLRLLWRLGPALGWTLPLTLGLLLLPHRRGRRVALALGLGLGALALVASGRPAGFVSGAYQERLLLPLVPLLALLVGESAAALAAGGPLCRGLRLIAAAGLALAVLPTLRPTREGPCGPPARGALFQACLRPGDLGWDWRPAPTPSRLIESAVPFAERAERVSVVVEARAGPLGPPDELAYARALLRGEAVQAVPAPADPAALARARPYVDTLR